MFALLIAVLLFFSTLSECDTYVNNQAKGSIVCKIFIIVSGNLWLPLRCTLGKKHPVLLYPEQVVLHIWLAAEAQVNIQDRREEEREEERKGEKRRGRMCHIHKQCNLMSDVRMLVFTLEQKQRVKQQVTPNTHAHAHLRDTWARRSKCLFLSANYRRLISDLFSVTLGQTRMSLLSAGKTQPSLATGGAANRSSQEFSWLAGIVVFQTTAGIKSGGFIGATLHPDLRLVHHFLCRRTRRHAKLNTQPHSTAIAAILAGKTWQRTEAVRAWCR